MCSIMMTATPRLFSLKRMSRISSTSELDSPAIASSEISSRGLAASARASSSLRRSTWVSRPELALARPRKPTRSRMSRAAASGSPPPRAAAYSMGIIRFCRIVMVRNGRGIWKLRTMPSRVRLCAGSLVMFEPLNAIVPWSQMSAPEMQLIMVVLPDPFGPIRPRRSPSPRWRSTPFSATNPPKRLVSPLTLRIGSAMALGLGAHAPVGEEADQPARGEDDEAHQHHPDQQHVELGGDGDRDHLLRRAEQERAQHRSVPVGGAADHGHGDGVDGNNERERGRRIDEGDEERVGRTRHA